MDLVMELAMEMDLVMNNINGTGDTLSPIGKDTMEVKYEHIRLSYKGEKVVIETTETETKETIKIPIKREWIAPKPRRKNFEK